MSEILPVDLWLYIFRYLGVEDLPCVNKVCRLVGIHMHLHLKNQDMEQRITIQEGGGDKKVNVLN